MSVWKDFVTAALLGTEKSGTLPALPASLESTLGAAANLEPETQFLTRAGALALWRRVGWKPIVSEATLAPNASAENNLAMVNAASAAHLRAMLSGHCAEALPEWLGAAARRSRRLPPELLPALLDWAKQNRERRPLVMVAGGARVRWLAGQNPPWNFAADDSPDHWETGTLDQRLAILRAWRAANPTDAREKLEAVWKSEPADARAAFMDVLAEHLSETDEPFLERALDDRGKEVRDRALKMLARLPGSAFVARMISRAEPLLVFKPGGLLRRSALEVTLPDEPDAANRDGLDPKAFGAYRKEFGDKAKVLMQILAAVPLEHWTRVWNQTPAVLVKALAKTEFAEPVATGWALAAIHQRDGVWAEALLDGPVKIPVAYLSFGGLFRTLHTNTRTERLVAAIRRGITAGFFSSEGWPHLFTALAADLPVLPENLVRETLAALRHATAADANGLPYLLKTMTEATALKMPPAMLTEAAEGWPMEKQTIAPFVELLTFRRDALAALAQP